jgi:CarboxypepD_reg-like domain
LRLGWFRTFCVKSVLMHLVPFRGGAGLWTARRRPSVVRGRVLHFKTGEVIEKAVVSTRDRGIGATTGHYGAFELRKVPPGIVELSVTTVGYGLLRRRIRVAAGSTMQVDLPIGQEALKHSDRVTVTAAHCAPVIADAPTPHTLNGNRLQNLSTALADDPAPTIHNLPGVTADQDFYADYAVPGADGAHIGVFFGGVPLDRPFYELRDQVDLGSLFILCGDGIESTSLLCGAFRVGYGDRTGAVLDVATRNGDRDRIQTRAGAGVLGASVTAEGPLRRSNKEPWLVSVRKTCAEYLLKRMIVKNGFGLGREDVEGKLTYHLTSETRPDCVLGRQLGDARSPHRFRRGRRFLDRKA